MWLGCLCSNCASKLADYIKIVSAACTLDAAPQTWMLPLRNYLRCSIAVALPPRPPLSILPLFSSNRPTEQWSMGSQINREIGLDLCPPKCSIKAILLITLPRETFTNITPRLVLMAVISSSNYLIPTNKFLLHFFSCKKKNPPSIQQWQKVRQTKLDNSSDRKWLLTKAPTVWVFQRQESLRCLKKKNCCKVLAI